MADKNRILAWQSRQAAKTGPPAAGAAAPAPGRIPCERYHRIRHQLARHRPVGQWPVRCEQRPGRSRRPGCRERRLAGQIAPGAAGWPRSCCPSCSRWRSRWASREPAGCARASSSWRSRSGRVARPWPRRRRSPARDRANSPARRGRGSRHLRHRERDSMGSDTSARVGSGQGLGPAVRNPAASATAHRPAASAPRPLPPATASSSAFDRADAAPAAGGQADTGRQRGAAAMATAGRRRTASATGAAATAARTRAAPA